MSVQEHRHAELFGEQGGDVDVVPLPLERAAQAPAGQPCQSGLPASSGAISRFSNAAARITPAGLRNGVARRLVLAGGSGTVVGALIGAVILLAIVNLIRRGTVR